MTVLFVYGITFTQSGSNISGDHVPLKSTPTLNFIHMEQWPGNPVASMSITQSPFDASIIPSSASTKATIAGGGTIEITVSLSYKNNSALPGQAVFMGELYKVQTGAWNSVDLQTRLLPAGATTTATSTLTLMVDMTDPTEQYAIRLRCGVTDSALVEMTPVILLQAGSFVDIGRFSLLFVPVSIVYCPPGQDMTNSLTQTRTFGTKFNLSFTGDLGWKSDDTSKVSGANVSTADDSNNSQIYANSTQDGVEISQTTNTTITADNQKAIGRAYWGPLGDLFVIAANLVFGVFKGRPDEADPNSTEVSFGPKLDGGEQVLIIPAWKLLRPGNDSIASLIPEDARRAILELDPFITNLDQFFPDSGADLSVAANPYADPSANNRAELIGRWWLDTGVEVNYSLGNTYQQSFIETNEESASFSIDELVSVIGPVGKDGNSIQNLIDTFDTGDITYQQSSETDSSTISNAACFLIRNQNDYDLDGIAVYYDKIFSTFMFQRLNSGKLYIPPPTQLKLGAGLLSGVIADMHKTPLRGMQMVLTGPKGYTLKTSSNINGQYSFYNLQPGSYTLSGGGKKSKVVIEEKSSPLKPTRVNVEQAKRQINVKETPLWEIGVALQLNKNQLQQIAPHIRFVSNEAALLKLTGIEKAAFQKLQKVAAFSYKKTEAAPKRGKSAAASTPEKSAAAAKKTRKEPLEKPKKNTLKKKNSSKA